MSGISLLREGVIVVAVIAGLTLVLTVLSLAGRRVRRHKRKAWPLTRGRSAGSREARPGMCSRPAVIRRP